MSRARAIGSVLLPWAGIAGAALGAGIAHQLGSDWVLTDCPDSTPLIVLVSALVGVAVVGAGAFGSWTVFARKAEEPARRLVASVSLMLCALVLLAIVLPVVAALVIPTCFA